MTTTTKKTTTRRTRKSTRKTPVKEAVIEVDADVNTEVPETTPLDQVSEVSEVSELDILQKLGYKVGKSLDTKLTKLSIKQYQKNNGLRITYKLDEDTKKSLQENNS